MSDHNPPLHRIMNVIAKSFINYCPRISEISTISHLRYSISGHVLLSDFNVQRAEDEDTNESILGKVFDKPNDAYNFYNDYPFLHGFGIRKDDTIKNTTTNEAYRKMYVCNKEDLFNEGYSRNLFWAHGRSKDAYTKFGDVVVFDVTYMTNKFMFPFATFVKEHRGREFYGVIKHFQDKALLDNDQYFVMDLCNEGYTRNMFWADGRSKDAYTKFGDVDVFDVTYMTNKFMFPSATFVGVNHHGQSIIFGGALLENEKEETFEWFFENFLKCMFRKYPNAIIIDQDKAIGNAIKRCSQTLDIDFVHGISRGMNLNTFERFLKDIFWAGTTTSGCSESSRSFFDGFGNSRTMLNELVIQYDKEVESRRAREEDEDFKTMNSTSVLSSVHPIEAKAGELYTRKIFDTFKKEWMYKVGNLSIGLGEMNNENGVSTFAIWCVRSNFTKLIEQSRDCPSEIHKINTLLLSLLNDHAIRKQPIALQNASQVSSMGISQVDMMPQISVGDPLGPINTKGHPKVASRIKSCLEAPKKRTCSYCQSV
ncbi:hypothetical protein LXL04_016086 [Taraxacum kok-saghyz]